MSQTSNYDAHLAAIDGIEVARLEDVARKVEVSICPSAGNIAVEMNVNGKPILMPPAQPLSTWKAKPGQAGIPFLAPWANRLDGDAFWANGKQYRLNPDVLNPRRDANGLPIHGLLLFAADWQVMELKADDSAALVTSRLEFWKHPRWMAQFPFAHSIDMTYRLSEGELEVRTTIRNHSLEPMPLSVGFHPWYQIPGCPRDEWTVYLPVRDHYPLTSEFVPTGETEPTELTGPTPLLGRHLDDVFGGVDSSEEFWVQGNGQRIAVRFGPKFPIAVVYAPLSRNVVCFEPMTGITNAMNLSHAGLYGGLQSVAPGETWQESFWIRTSGF